MLDPNLMTVLIAALCIVESGGDPDAVGDNGAAIGVLQIHVCVITDVNKFCGGQYTRQDRRDEVKSKRICELYLNKWGSYYENTTNNKVTLEVLSAIWCSGPNGWKKMDKKGIKEYIAKVKKELTKSNK